jgi:biopolymer transport protein ExbD
MNKIVNFLIVVVLIARGAIYIYDNNKDKIDKFVAPVNTITTENSTNTNSSATPTDAKDAKEVSFSTLTFLVTGDKEIYYYVGPFSGTLNAVNRDYVGVFIKAYKNNINPDDLMFIIKSDKNATFKNVIDLMDEMTKNEVPQGHYKEGDITQEETDKINLIKNSKNG